MQSTARPGCHRQQVGEFIDGVTCGSGVLILAGFPSRRCALPLSLSYFYEAIGNRAATVVALPVVSLQLLFTYLFAVPSVVQDSPSSVIITSAPFYVRGYTC